MCRPPFDDGTDNHYGREWALLLFDQPVLSLPGATCIATKHDLNLEAADASCRIMFCGSLVHAFTHDGGYKALKLFRVRSSHTFAAAASVTLCVGMAFRASQVRTMAAGLAHSALLYTPADAVRS